MDNPVRGLRGACGWDNSCGDCKPAAFAPTFRAGVENPVAAPARSAHVSFGRSDDDEDIQMGHEPE
jgi:hypothetical protein